MRNLLNQRGRDSVAGREHEMPPATQHQDRLAFIALLVAGLILVSVCHYSLVQLSEFYGLVIAALTAEQRKAIGESSRSLCGLIATLRPPVNEFWRPQRP